MNFENLHGAIDTVEKEYQIVFPLVTGGIGYGENRRWNLEPNREFSNIKPNSKKMLQVVINRLDSGRYELITYIL